MKNTPLLSIISGVYNSGELLLKFLDSLSNQTYNNIEVILINDCSTDKVTNNILRDLESGTIQFNKPIKIFHNEKNLGVIDTFQKGLDNASGEYFAFPESDDYMDYDFYEKMMDVAKTNYMDVVKGLLLYHMFYAHGIESNVEINDNENIMPIKDSCDNIVSFIINDFAYSFFHIFSKRILLHNSDKLKFENAVKYASDRLLYYNYREYKMPLTTQSFYHFNRHEITKHSEETCLKLLNQTKPILKHMLEDCENAISELKRL